MERTTAPTLKLHHAAEGGVEGTMKVLVVAEFYPRQGDPVLGVWAHRQALAARDAGAEVRVVVLHRLVPPRASFSRRTPAAQRALCEALAGEPRHQVHDGLDVTYVRYASPPRSSSYPAWGAWAAPALGLALRRLRRSFAFDLIHAHNAVPAGDAVRRTRSKVPLIVSVHGGDVLYTAPRSDAGSEAVRRALEAATTVLANSRGIAQAQPLLRRRETFASSTLAPISRRPDREAPPSAATRARRWLRSATSSHASVTPT